jgi:hypothetical protein
MLRSGLPFDAERARYINPSKSLGASIEVRNRNAPTLLANRREPFAMGNVGLRAIFRDRSECLFVGRQATVAHCRKADTRNRTSRTRTLDRPRPTSRRSRNQPKSTALLSMASFLGRWRSEALLAQPATVPSEPTCNRACRRTGSCGRFVPLLVLFVVVSLSDFDHRQVAIRVAASRRILTGDVIPWAFAGFAEHHHVVEPSEIGQGSSPT